MLIITFHNDGTGKPTKLIGNYDYKVYINRELIATGRIEKHNRKHGWEGLVSLLAKQVQE